jgi:hypothetical protein
MTATLHKYIFHILTESYLNKNADENCNFSSKFIELTAIMGCNVTNSVHNKDIQRSK